MDILDIFYNHIVKEAAVGRIYCGFYYNILFETDIVSENKKIGGKASYNDVLIPTLIIKDKDLFDKLLIKYVNLALDFYDNLGYYPEAVEEKEDFEKYSICEEKLIMTHLWSNATSEDFKDPISFLRKRVAFLESNIGEITPEFAFSPMLDGTISLSVIQEALFNEAPFSISIKSINETGMTYNFPEVKFGIANDTVYIYAIQNYSDSDEKYYKKVNRALYKVGEGFDSNEDNYNNYEEGNLKDISPSFLVALNMAVSYLNSLGYSKIVVPSILISRWNAKKIAIHNKAPRLSEDNKEEFLKEQDRIQHNLTEKLIRTFLRLAHHYDNIHINSIPFEVDSNLHISINGDLKSNNELLNETAQIVKINNKNRNI